jgi:hypothetical protein
VNNHGKLSFKLASITQGMSSFAIRNTLAAVLATMMLCLVTILHLFLIDNEFRAKFESFFTQKYISKPKEQPDV